VHARTLAQESDEPQTAHAWHADVAKHHVGSHPLDHDESNVAVVGLGYNEAANRSQRRSDRSPHEWFVVHDENLDPIKVGHATVSGSEIKLLIANHASRHATIPDGPLQSNRGRFIPYS
jgi:hypothetical protein